ncbi:MAG: tRNA (N6-isopentenyl adenosine(37)-C2)-methylthiotransferase MiaB [Bacilli bacterium]
MLPNFCEAKVRTKDKVAINNFEIDNQYLNLCFNKTYFIKTYGCQMNEHDTENIKAILELMGFTEALIMDEADLILLNTCAIRENAHNKVFGMIGRIKHLKASKPHIMVGICGCMAQEEAVALEIKNKFKWLDIVFGTHNINDLPAIISTSLTTKQLEIEVLSNQGNIIENMPVKRASKYKAWINIMYGCDKFCTYCIVPYTRGKQRSRLPNNIIDEIKELIKDGYQEVTLLGQNVNAYGKDLAINYNMADLLNAVAQTGIKRIFFVTSHPWDFNDDMIEAIKNNSNVLPYIHLPLQAGSNKILKKMGRRYTKESYIELFNKLKNSIPRVAITTDIIVGFPNESEEDFKETLDVVNICKFDSAFTFIFSPRAGTPAAKMIDNVSLDIKNKRLQILNELINKYSNEANLKYQDKIVDVLIEQNSKKKPNMLMGYTDTMKLVNVTGDISNIGHIVKVKIKSIKTWSMDGVIVK